MSDENKEFDLEQALEILNAIGKIAGFAIDICNKVSRAYGIIEKDAFIKYGGKEGRLVWDYLLVNELTFEEAETGIQQSFGKGMDNEKTEKMFNLMVEKFGI